MQQEMAARFDELAARQHGLVTSAQAVEALGPNRKARWVRERRLVMVQPGVLRAVGSPQTWHQTLHAVALATDGVVSHRAAAELWGLIRPAGYAEVSVGYDHNPRTSPPAILHRVRDLDLGSAVEREGMPVTDPVRTVMDLGLVAPRLVVRDALSRGLTSKLISFGESAELRDALGRPGRTGAGLVRRIRAQRSLAQPVEEGLLEARFAALLADDDLPRPAFQHEVWASGRFVARVDVAFPLLRLAIEVDGHASHPSPDASRRDLERQNQLISLGWTVLRFSWPEIVNAPGRVARTIAATLRRLEAA